MLISNRKANINPEALSYFGKANFKRRMKNHKEAIEDYTKALELYPNFAEAYYKRANVKVTLGDNEGALKDYNKAIEIDPNLAEAYNNRGILKLKLGNENGANLDFLQAGMLGYVRAYDVNKDLCL